MLHEDEIDQSFQEFRRLTRRYGGSSTAMIQYALMSLTRASNEIRRSNWQAHVEDGPEEAVEGGEALHGHLFQDDNSLSGYGALSMQTSTGNEFRPQAVTSVVD